MADADDRDNALDNACRTRDKVVHGGDACSGDESAARSRLGPASGVEPGHCVEVMQGTGWRAV